MVSSPTFRNTVYQPRYPTNQAGLNYELFKDNDSQVSSKPVKTQFLQHRNTISILSASKLFTQTVFWRLHYYHLLSQVNKKHFRWNDKDNPHTLFFTCKTLSPHLCIWNFNDDKRKCLFGDIYPTLGALARDTAQSFSIVQTSVFNLSCEAVSLRDCLYPINPLE